MNAEERKRYYSTETPRFLPALGQIPIRSFYCRKCGKLVEIYFSDDRRTVFCTRSCEKKYWRHPPKDRGRGGNLGMSGGMSLGSLIRRERRSLD